MEDEDMKMNLRKPALPTAVPMPPPLSPLPVIEPVRNDAARHALAVHERYAEEAARAAQRFLDQAAQIEQLIDERDHWRNRALLAEGQVIRADQREAALLAKVEEKTEQVLAERDAYKMTLTQVAAHYDSASKILLDGYDAIKTLEGKINAKRFRAKLTPEQQQQQQDQLARTLAEPATGKVDDAIDTLNTLAQGTA